jgi:hypothetical protein
LSRFKLLSLLTAGLVLPLALAACGGDGDGGGGGADEAEITAAIEFAATSGDPAACTEAQTQSFNEQTTGETGEAAVEACERDAADTPADSIEVSSIAVDGDSATAQGTIVGSAFDGQTIELALVREGEAWKLDELIGFAEFDREALIAGFTEEIASDPGTPEAAKDCVVKAFSDLSDQELQDGLLDPDESFFAQLFGPCFGD